MKDPQLQKQLKDLLVKANAHVSMDSVLDGTPLDILGVVPDKLPYSIWQIAEHIRIAQWDILDFSRNPDYHELDWPKDYWPEETAPKGRAAWDHCVTQIKKDRADFIDMLEDDNSDIYKAFPWGSGQNLLREALLIADHNSYHTAEIVVIRRLLGHWK